MPDRTPHYPDALTACDTLTPSLTGLIEASQFLAAQLYTEMCRVYLMDHHRLPGSTRTARLRKKRLTRLSRWVLDM